MLLLLTSLFFTNPAPLEMPRAEGYLVREQKGCRLEDRFNRLDLWTSQTVDGRWIDDEGREFVLATLAFRPPAVMESAAETRAQYVASRVAVNRKKPEQVREALAALAPVEIAEKPVPPRQLPRGYADVDYWQGTNTSAIVATFRPLESNVWYLATWTLAADDEFDEMRKSFEDVFLAKKFLPFLTAMAGRNQTSVPPSPPARKAKKGDVPSEAELLRADARHSVAAYESWRTTDAESFSILDDLPRSTAFVSTLTNELVQARRAYLATLPTPLDTSNVLCVARIFANRDEYLDALEVEDRTNMTWSAAYWSPQRRELVAYLPSDGDRELLRTIRHEAFHQYLSYATSLLPTSPWLNEGYAQYFEAPDDLSWGVDFNVTPESLEKMAEILPSIFGLDYAAFYAGTDRERRLKYRLAWSVAVFVEKGAPKVRFQPFEDLKRDYVETLLETQDPLKATAAAFRDEDTRKLFVREWLRWWREHD